MRLNSAQLYNLIYGNKNYAAETQRLQQFIRQAKRSPNSSLLDVACGTGRHLYYLNRLYESHGVDLNPELLAAARSLNPGVPFDQADMIDFALDKKFDVITCLFSAIGYVETVENLNISIANMANHLKPGGVLLVEPWFGPDDYVPGRPFAIFIDQPDLKVSRMNVSRIDNGVSVLDFHYLIADDEGVEHYNESHRLGLFTEEQYMQAFRKAGLEVSYDADGLIGRGLYTGVRTAENAS